MARGDHSVRGIAIPEIRELEMAAINLQESLGIAPHDEIIRNRNILQEISDRIPIEDIPSPLDSLQPIPSGIDDLDTTGGIYIFCSDRGHYIGLTENIRVRFYIPTYGHLTDNNNSTSRHVLACEDWQVYILEGYTQPESSSNEVNTNLSRDEIFWYYLLRNHPDFQFVNAEANIGRTADHSGFPTLTYCWEDRTYALYSSIGSAYRESEVNSGNALRHMLESTTSRYGHVRMLKTTPNATQIRYFFFRFATEQEVGLLGTNYPYQRLLDRIRQGGSDMNLVYRDGENTDRNSRFVWNCGEVAPEIIERLTPYCRGTYNLDGPQSQFDYGISWHSHNRCWQIRAKCGPQYTDLWQPTRPGDSEIQAAVFREREIVRNDWAQYNLSVRQGYPSNAVSLNRLLPPEQQLPIW